MEHKGWWIFSGVVAFIVIGNVITLQSNGGGQAEATEQHFVVGFGAVDISPRYAAESAKQGVREAIRYWQSQGYDIEFTEGTEYDVRVDFLREYGGEHLGLTYLKYVQVSLGDSDCGGGWTPYSPNSVRHIATHEIGHALGLPHNTAEPTDIMFPVTTPHYGRACGFGTDYQFEPGGPQIHDVTFVAKYPATYVLEGDGSGNYFNICYRPWGNATDPECSEPGFDPARLEVHVEQGLHRLRLICRTNSEDCLMPYRVELQPDAADLIDTKS